MSTRKLAFVPLDTGEESRFYAHVSNMLESENDKERRKAERLAKEQIELWDNDDSCPYAEDDRYWTDFHAEVCLDMWKELV